MSYDGSEPVMEDAEEMRYYPAAEIAESRGVEVINPQLLEALLKYDLPDYIREVIAVELSRDFVLANYSEEEVFERKYELKNILEYITMLFPPRSSILQGELRLKIYGDDTRKALTKEQLQRIKQALSLAYARVTRARKGWQQEILSRQTREVREFKVGGGEKEKKSFLSRLFG